MMRSERIVLFVIFNVIAMVSHGIRISRVATAFTQHRPIYGVDRRRVSLCEKQTLADPTTVSSRVFADDNRPVILFDGVCNMCNSAVNTALDWDPNGKLRFAALQSNVGRSLLQANGREANDISSIVLVTSNGAYIKSDAILRITEELSPKWQPLPITRIFARTGRFLVPGLLSDLIYDGVANNRYRILGMRDECRLGNEDAFRDRFVDDTIAE